MTSKHKFGVLFMLSALGCQVTLRGETATARHARPRGSSAQPIPPASNAQGAAAPGRSPSVIGDAISTGPTQASTPEPNAGTAAVAPAPTPPTTRPGDSLVDGRPGNALIPTPPATNTVPAVVEPFQRPTAPNQPGMNFSTLFGSPSASAGSWVGDVYFPDATTTTLAKLKLGKPVVSLYTDRLNVPPQPFYGFANFGGRKNNFVVMYNGTVQVTEEKDYQLRLVAADGARAFIDGMLIVDLDGEHEAASKAQLVHLVKATHTVRIEYFHNQAKNVALQVYIKPANARTEYLLTPGTWVDAVSAK